MPMTCEVMAWVLAQAVTVVLLAEAQWMGLQATRPGRLQPQGA